MDNFDKIVKEKAENFEVPFNDAHWAEMEEKLSSIRAAKVKSVVIGISASIITLGIASYLIFSTPSTKDISMNSTTILNHNSSSQLTESDNDVLTKETNSFTSNSINNSFDKDIKTPDSESIQRTNDITIEHAPNNEDGIDAKIINNNNSNTKENGTQLNPLNVEFIVYNNRVCEGQQVSFEAIESNAPVSYMWDFGDGKTSNKEKPKHTYLKSGVYTVTLTVVNRQSGKRSIHAKKDAVNILPNPKTEFTYIEESKKQDDNKLMYPYTKFSVKNVDKQTNYKWIFGNGNTATNPNPKTIYEEKGSYKVTLISESFYGCISSQEKTINVDGINLYAPNALKINSDITENAVFIPKALIEWDIPFEMTISDKAGKPIYKTSDSNAPWNGKVNNNGPQVEEGIYFWQVSIKDAEGNTKLYQDKIYLKK